MEWLWGRKYLALLTALLLLLVVYPVLRESVPGRIVLDAILTIFFVALFVVVFAQRHRLLAVMLGIPTLVGLCTGYALPALPPTVASVTFHFVGALMLSLCVVAILREIYSDPTITLDNIHGALCGYLLVAMAFSHLYGLIETLVPGAFFVEGAPLAAHLDGGQRHFLLAYFSLTTLTTVGYGDVVPVHSSARGLAVVEAVIGQFYLAVLIGELIGKRVSQAIEDRQAGNQG